MFVIFKQLNIKIINVIIFIPFVYLIGMVLISSESFATEFWSKWSENHLFISAVWKKSTAMTFQWTYCWFKGGTLSMGKSSNHKRHQHALQRAFENTDSGKDVCENILSWGSLKKLQLHQQKRKSAVVREHNAVIKWEMTQKKGMRNLRISTSPWTFIVISAYIFCMCE